MNNDIANLLSLWSLDSSGNSVPLVHSRAIADLNALVPSRSGQDLLDSLCAEGLVRATVRGEYELTERGISIRKKLSDANVPKPECNPAIVHDPQEWSRFKKLCGYWIDCVRLQERPQEVLFRDGENRDWFVPRLPAGWLAPLATGNAREVSITTVREHAAARAKILARQDDDEEISVGYPVRVFVSRNGTAMVVPLAIVPVDLVEFSETTMKLRLRLDEADINQGWIDYNIAKERENGVLRTLFQAGGSDGVLDLAKAIPILEAEVPEKERNTFCPDTVDWRVPDAIDGRPTVANVPVLFVGQPLKYSKTLQRELRFIREQTAETLDGTALAYVFREHPFGVGTTERNREPVPFLPMNPEQREACKQALNRPLTKVQGPPGTGKSHASVNLIANLLYRGESVLFTSKNHKAVEAIAENAASILDGTGIDLVHFCGGGEGEPENPWYRQDLDALVANGRKADSAAGSRNAEVLDGVLRRIAAFSRQGDIRRDILRRVEDANQEVESIVAKIEGIFPQLGIRNKSERETMRTLARCRRLFDAEETKWSWRHPVRSLRWMFGGKLQMDTALGYLHADLPEAASGTIPFRDIRIWAGECRPLCKSYYRKLEQLNKWEKEARNAEGGFVSPALLRDCLATISPIAKSALAARLSVPISALERDSGRMELLKSVMSLLRRANSPWFFSRLEDTDRESAAAGFRQFQKAFPGWATTLLSLTKASPCIPGIFDHVIVDEASQCEVPPIIPALFRAKAATIVGDPNQFPPVRTLRENRNDWLMSQHSVAGLSDQTWNFLTATAYSVCNVPAILFRDHFRCDPEIAACFNDEFYGGELRVQTASERLRFPRNMGWKHAVDWIDVRDSEEGEIAAVESELRRLVETGYKGSVGIVTPFRDLADELQRRLSKIGKKLEGFVVGTANAFQGGEKDVIFFVLGYTSTLPHGKNWYVEASENRYIFNVAASRAKACLRLVGDRRRCAESSVSALRNLAAQPRVLKAPPPGKTPFESIWEKRLFNALVDAGIHPEPQYPTLGRRLDFALIQGERKLDIEVDGVKFHTDSHGNRKVDDIWRDEQLLGAGWEVMRFWSFQLRDNMPKCVSAVSKWMTLVK